MRKRFVLLVAAGMSVLLASCSDGPVEDVGDKSTPMLAKAISALAQGRYRWAMK